MANLNSDHKERVIQTYSFSCPQCDLDCKSSKIQGEVDGEVSLRIENEHNEPQCSMFVALNEAEFLNAHAKKKIAAKAATG